MNEPTQTCAMFKCGSLPPAWVDAKKPARKSSESPGSGTGSRPDSMKMTRSRPHVPQLLITSLANEPMGRPGYGSGRYQPGTLSANVTNAVTGTFPVDA